MPERMRFEFPVGRGAPRRNADAPRRMLVMADLSAAEPRGRCETADVLGARPITSVDVDRVDDVLARLRASLELSAKGPGGTPVTFEAKRLEDFHPDRLYETLDVFRVLRDTRTRVLDPRTFAAAAEALGRAVRSPDPAAADPAAGADDASTLERLLGQRPRPLRQRVDISGLIRGLVAPYVVPDADPRQPEVLKAVDEVTAAVMRAVLHHPDFQALEAAWRSVHWLLARVDVGETWEVHLLDVTKRELTTDVREAGGELERSGLYRAVVERSARSLGEAPWSMIVADVTFGPDAPDVELLAALGTVASRAGGPLLAAADPRVLGCSSLVETPDPRTWQTPDTEAAARWTALRHSPSAAWIGLALPRLLLRLPYGKKTDPIERFEFEEMVAPSDHEAYLWGNPAFGCAALLASSDEPQDIDDLPAHAILVDGESRLTPCAEVLLSERAGEAILRHGLMPLLSYPNRNAARVMRFQSIAEPAAPLAGSRD